MPTQVHHLVFNWIARTHALDVTEDTACSHYSFQLTFRHHINLSASVFSLFARFINVCLLCSAGISTKPRNIKSFGKHGQKSGQIKSDKAARAIWYRCYCVRRENGRCWICNFRVERSQVCEIKRCFCAFLWFAFFFFILLCDVLASKHFWPAENIAHNSCVYKWKAPLMLHI